MATVTYKQSKIAYGVSNVVIFPKSGTKMEVPGATKISAAPQGTSTPIYADNITWMAIIANTGYTLGFEDYFFPTAVKNFMEGREEHGGYVRENADVVEYPEFGLAYQIETDQGPNYFYYPNCRLNGRPSLETETKQDQINPNPMAIEIVASPDADGTVYIWTDDATKGAELLTEPKSWRTIKPVS